MRRHLRPGPRLSVDTLAGWPPAAERGSGLARRLAPLAAALLLLPLALASCSREALPPTAPVDAAAGALDQGPAPGGGGAGAARAQPAATDTFVLRAYGVDEVYLAGAFNGWSTNNAAYRLTADGDGYTWRLAVTLPAGLQPYKFVLWKEGSAHWVTDPLALEVIYDGYSGSPAYWNALRGRSFTRPRALASPPERNRLVIYEIAPNDFSTTGTFAGIQGGFDSGPALTTLGVNAIELMPVTAPAYNGWGYDPVLPAAVNPSYGNPATFAAMVDAAHARGMAVILDAVLNHGAGSHVLRQLDTIAGGYNFTTTEPNPWGMVEMNWANPALKAVMLDALCLWVDRYRVDGFRFDYVGGEPYSTWIWIRDQLRARYPGLLLIAEDFTYPAYGNAVTNGYDAQWGGNHTDGWGGGGNNFNQVMITTLTEKWFSTRGQTYQVAGAFGTEYSNMWATANVISGNAQYAGPGLGDGFSDVKYLESHDENRLVWCVDNYGSAGAMAVGGLAKAHLGALALLTTVGIPMLFNGQEIGADEWRNPSPAIYKIDWAAGDQDLRAAYAHLIELRLREPALQSEHVFFQWRDGIVDQEQRTLVYWRGSTASSAAAEIVVACNFDSAGHAWTVPFPAAGGWFRLHPVEGSWEPVAVPAGGLPLALDASTGALFKRADGLTGVPD